MQLYMGQTLQEFSMKWSHWQQECRHRVDNETYAGNPSLHTLCQVHQYFFGTIHILLSMVVCYKIYCSFFCQY